MHDAQRVIFKNENAREFLYTGTIMHSRLEIFSPTGFYIFQPNQQFQIT